jgi:hypothetical protein
MLHASSGLRVEVVFFTGLSMLATPLLMSPILYFCEMSGFELR